MKIAQLVSNFHPVHPQQNMAIYSHVAWLTNGLINQGHTVTLFGAGNSNTKAKLHSILPIASKAMSMNDEMRKYYVHSLVSQCYRRAKEFDIIHSHFNILSSFYSNLVDTPTVQAIHSPISTELRPLLMQFKNNRYISFSLAQRKSMPDLNWVANIYHGVDTKIFSYNPEPKDYMLFLGRITEDKGVHYAIEAAKAAGVQLIIAGRSYPAEGYWHDKIEKHIDGVTVRYVGEANFETKIEWLKNAKALLFPTQYNEAFGYTMIEAMACGTPVIGWRNGSTPEIIADGKTGYVVENVPDMVQTIKKIDTISRAATRKRAEQFFSVEKMVSGYAKVYERITKEREYKKQNGNYKL